MASSSSHNQHRRKRSEMTPEDLALERERARKWQKKRLDNMSPEQLRIYREQQRNYQRQRYKNLTDAQRNARREAQRIRDRERQTHSHSKSSSTQSTGALHLMSPATQSDFLTGPEVLQRIQTYAQSEVARIDHSNSINAQQELLDGTPIVNDIYNQWDLDSEDHNVTLETGIQDEDLPTENTTTTRKRRMPTLQRSYHNCARNYVDCPRFQQFQLGPFSICRHCHARLFPGESKNTTSAERSEFYNDTHLDFNLSQVQQHPFTSVHQQNPIYQTPNNGFYRETQQNTNVVNKNKVVGQDRNFSNWYSENPKENYGSNCGDVVSRDLQNSQQAAVVVNNSGNFREFGQNLNTQDRNFSFGYSENSNGFDGGGANFIDSRQNRPNGYSIYQNGAYAGGGEFIHNKNGYRFQAIGSSICRGDDRKFQHNINESYGGNVEQLDKNKTGHQVKQLNDNGRFHREASIGLQPNPIRIQRGVGDFLPLTYANVDNESADTCAYEGTIEELDTFCKENKVEETLEVLEILENKGVTVDLPRYVLLIQACGNIGFLPFAKFVHDHLIKSEGPVHQIYVHNKILEMYSNCGSMCDVHEVFENMPERNLTSWDTMITGLAKNGHGEDSIDLFTRFKQSGLRPDGQMFMGVFSACGVVCDIDEGMFHFESMRNAYGLVPSMEHYTGVVKMLGSVGYLDEAMEFIKKIPFEPTLDVWETLMDLCRHHGNFVLEDQCSMIVKYFDPSRLKDKSKEEASGIAKEIQKTKLSNAFQGLNKRAETFLSGDTSHAEKDITYALSRRLNAHMKEAGYVPAIRVSLHDVDDESKEEDLLSHSERLAVAHGLLNSAARQPMRIMNNPHVCIDCHNALKFIAKIVGREFIVWFV